MKNLALIEVVEAHNERMVHKIQIKKPPLVEVVRDIVAIGDAKTVGLSDFSWNNFKAVASDTSRAVFDRKLLTLAAGSAYYVTLAIIPIVAAVLAVAGRIMSTDDLYRILQVSRYLLPEELSRFVGSQLPQVINSEPQHIWVIILMVVFALFMASNAMDNFMNALNAAFNLKELRGPLKFKLTSIVLGATAVFLLLCNGFLMLISTQALRDQTDATWPQTLVMNIFRILLIFILTSLVVTLLYRFAPHHKNPRVSWVTWGALMASAFWTLATLLFFVYIQYFVDFTQVFGVLAGIFVLMAWIELSCIILVVGAAINGRLTKEAEQLYQESR